MSYDKLVFATGASPIIPPLPDQEAELIMTMNSLEEYRQAESRLEAAKSVLVIGAGLVGTGNCDGPYQCWAQGHSDRPSRQVDARVTARLSLSAAGPDHDSTGQHDETG